MFSLVAKDEPDLRWVGVCGSYKTGSDQPAYEKGEKTLAWERSCYREGPVKFRISKRASFVEVKERGVSMLFFF